MKKCEKKSREGVFVLPANHPDRTLEAGPEQRKLTAQNAIAPAIEISDADYRTLHLPCDALEESGEDKPGH